MLRYIILLLLLIFSIISDIKYSRIHNIYVIPTAVIGLSINTFENGYQGFKSSLIGMLVPILLLWLLFYARLIGAGDVKLFSAIGALFGYKFIINCMAYSFVIAGVFSIIYLLKSKKSSQLESLSILKIIRRLFYDFYIRLKNPYLIFNENILIRSRGSKNIIKLSPYVATGVCLQILFHLS